MKKLATVVAQAHSADAHSVPLNGRLLPSAIERQIVEFLPLHDIGNVFFASKRISRFIDHYLVSATRLYYYLDMFHCNQLDTGNTRNCLGLALKCRKLRCVVETLRRMDSFTPLTASPAALQWKLQLITGNVNTLQRADFYLPHKQADVTPFAKLMFKPNSKLENLGHFNCYLEYVADGWDLVNPTNLPMLKSLHNPGTRHVPTSLQVMQIAKGASALTARVPECTCAGFSELNELVMYGACSKTLQAFSDAASSGCFQNMAKLLLQKWKSATKTEVRQLAAALQTLPSLTSLELSLKLEGAPSTEPIHCTLRSLRRLEFAGLESGETPVPLTVTAPRLRIVRVNEFMPEYTPQLMTLLQSSTQLWSVVVETRSPPGSNNFEKAAEAFANQLSSGAWPSLTCVEFLNGQDEKGAVINELIQRPRKQLRDVRCSVAHPDQVRLLLLGHRCLETFAWTATTSYVLAVDAAGITKATHAHQYLDTMLIDDGADALLSSNLFFPRVQHVSARRASKKTKVHTSTQRLNSLSSVLRCCPKLRSLRVCDMPVNILDEQDLDRQFPCLNMVVLNDVGLKQADVTALCKLLTNCPNLSSLELKDNGFSDAVNAEQLRALISSLPHLRYASLKLPSAISTALARWITDNKLSWRLRIYSNLGWCVLHAVRAL